MNELLQSMPSLLQYITPEWLTQTVFWFGVFVYVLVGFLYACVTMNSYCLRVVDIFDGPLRVFCWPAYMFFELISKGD